MCMQCVGAVGTALQAATLVGGPYAYKQYRRVRNAFGLPDNSVAAVEARAAGGEDRAPARGPSGAPQPADRGPKRLQVRAEGGQPA